MISCLSFVYIFSLIAVFVSAQNCSNLNYKTCHNMTHCRWEQSFSCNLNVTYSYCTDLTCPIGSTCVIIKNVTFWFPDGCGVPNTSLTVGHGDCCFSEEDQGLPPYLAALVFYLVMSLSCLFYVFFPAVVVILKAPVEYMLDEKALKIEQSLDGVGLEVIEYIFFIVEFLCLSSFAFLPNVPWGFPGLEMFGRIWLFNFNSGFLYVYTIFTILVLLVAIFGLTLLPKYSQKWYSCCVVVLFDIILIPFLFMHSVALVCNYEDINISYMLNSPTTRCWDGVHLGVVFVSIVSIIIYFVGAAHFSFQPNRRFYFSEKFRMMLCTGKFFLCLFSAPLQTVQPWFLLLYVVVITQFVVRQFRTQPAWGRSYYSNCVRMCTLSGVLWACIWACITSILSKPSQHWPFYIYIVGLGPVMVGCWFLNGYFYDSILKMQYREHIPDVPIIQLLQHPKTTPNSLKIVQHVVLSQEDTRRQVIDQTWESMLQTTSTEERNKTIIWFSSCREIFSSDFFAEKLLNSVDSDWENSENSYLVLNGLLMNIPAHILIHRSHLVQKKISEMISKRQFSLALGLVDILVTHKKTEPELVRLFLESVHSGWKDNFPVDVKLRIASVMSFLLLHGWNGELEKVDGKEIARRLSMDSDEDVARKGKYIVRDFYPEMNVE